MDVRIVTPEECLEYYLLCDVCFFSTAEEGYADWHKDMEKHTKGYENTLGGFDDQNNLIAGLGMIPYRMNFDGQVVDMCGIQAVVTAPEARASGVMTKVLDECLRIMKEKGQIFSVLYPFSYGYYRKFGYEVAYRLRKMEVPIDVFCNYPYPKDSVRFWKKGDDIEDIKAVYDAFKKRYNYAIDRDDENWKTLTKHDPYTTKRYTYIHYDSQGNPDAYLIFRVSDRMPDHPTYMYIDELAWTSKDGLFAMFGFIGGLRPQADKVFWDVPEGMDLFSWFPEAREATLNIHPTAMTRIVDLPKVLEKLRPPSMSKDRVVIDVMDKSMPCNTGRYAIAWENNTLSVEKTDQDPDMVTTIEAMAQMVIGYLNSDEAAYRQDTTIYSQHEALLSLFPKKNLYLWEKF